MPKQVVISIGLNRSMSFFIRFSKPVAVSPPQPNWATCSFSAGWHISR